MKCVQCGSKTTVTLSYDGDDAQPRHGWLIDRALRVFGWWSTSDFRVRSRVCRNKTCGFKSTTVEVCVEDLRNALDDVKTTALITGQCQSEPHTMAGASAG